MATNPPQISLAWRDENHGSVHAVAAFRVYSATVDWSQRTHAKFRACVRRAGFAFHDGRCADIATTGEQATREKPCATNWPRLASRS